MTIQLSGFFFKDKSDINSCTVICAADQLIKFTKGEKENENKVKLFRINNNGLNVAIGYYGLATYKSYKLCFMKDLLEGFIEKLNEVYNIKEVSEKLFYELNKNVDKDLLAKHVSGFHITGINKVGIPEFYQIMNHREYNDLFGTYELTDDQFPYYYKNIKDNEDPLINTILLTNGDLIPVKTMFEGLNNIHINLIRQRIIRPLDNSKEILNFVKFIIETIIRMFEYYPENQNIGGNIDIFCLK